MQLAAADELSPSEAAKRGQQQFAQSCGFCHAPDATGTSEGPDLIRSSLVRHDDKGNFIGPVIRNGRPAKGMSPVKLSEAQIADVVEFLHWRLLDAGRASPEEAHDLPLKTLLTGNAGAGKTYFNGAGGCARCHSPSGDLAGIAKKYSPADLQARFLYPPNVPKTATVTEASGRRLTGELAYEDAFSVAITDHGGWYRSWPRDHVTVQIHDPLAAHLELLRKYTESDVHNVFAYLETLR